MQHQTVGESEPMFYRYACAESAVGRLLVVMTDEAVVDIILGDELREMLRTASSRHPGAGFIPDRNVHADRVACIVKRFEQPTYCAGGIDVDHALGTTV